MRLSKSHRHQHQHRPWTSSANLLFWLLVLTTLPSSTQALDKTVIVTVTEAATTKVTATATATPKVPQDPSYTSLPLFKSSVLDTTNAYRAVHNASDLTWNDTLAGFAKDWAETCWWKHSGGPYGENLAYGYTNATAAVAAWGAEASLYDFSKPTGFTEETGHFTQLVWKATREVGCAAVDCGLTDLDVDGGGNGDGGGRKRAQGWYVVCEYVPGGNIIGARDSLEYFRVNVQEGKGKVDLNGDDQDADGDGDEDEEDQDDDDDTGGDDSGPSQEDIIQTIIRGGGGKSLRWSASKVGWWVGIVYILSTA
ncbi:CAP domain-containing protein [Aspergillus unguis]